MKKFSKILVFSVLAVFLMAGSAMATPIYTSASSIVDLLGGPDNDGDPSTWDVRHSGGSLYDAINDQTGAELWTPNADLATPLRLIFQENFEIGDAFGIYNSFGAKAQVFPGDLGTGTGTVETAVWQNLDGDGIYDDLIVAGGTYFNFGISFGYYFEHTYADQTTETVYSERHLNDGIRGSNHVDEDFFLAYRGEVGATMDILGNINKTFGATDWIIAADWYDHGNTGDGADDYFLKDFDDVVVYVSEAGPVPEPATMLLLGSGLIGLAGLGRRKFFKKG